MLGQWRNFEELEDALCIEELYAILEAAREQQYENWKFQASLKGINLDENEQNSNTLDDIKIRAAAEIRGVPQEQIHLDFIGIGIEEETE